jgi:hypothetical protein
VNGIYCCGGNNQSCCNSGQGRLSVVYDALVATAATSPAISTQSIFPSASSTPSTSIIGSSSSDAMKSSTATIYTPTIPSFNLTGTNNGKNSSTSGSAGSGGGDTFGQMGIGVALGLGTPLLLILGACAFLFYRLRETRLQVRKIDGPIVRAKRSINTLREKRSMATLNEEDGRWI